MVILISTFLSKLGVGHYSYWIGSIWLNYLHDGDFSSDFKDGSRSTPDEETGAAQLVDKTPDTPSKERMQKLSKGNFTCTNNVIKSLDFERFELSQSSPSKLN